MISFCRRDDGLEKVRVAMSNEWLRTPLVLRAPSIACRLAPLQNSTPSRRRPAYPNSILSRKWYGFIAKSQLASQVPIRRTAEQAHWKSATHLGDGSCRNFYMHGSLRRIITTSDRSHDWHAGVTLARQRQPVSTTKEKGRWLATKPETIEGESEGWWKERAQSECTDKDLLLAYA